MKPLFILVLTFGLLCCNCSAQSLSPNADSEILYNKTIKALNQGQITAGEAHSIFMTLIEVFHAPSESALRVHGPHIWKLAVQKESAYFHRLSEAAIASLIEKNLGREAASSAWAQQLKYANIYKQAEERLRKALK